LAGERAPVFSDTAWALFQHLALFAGILLAALISMRGARALAGVSSFSTAVLLMRRFMRQQNAALVLFVVLYAGELVAYTQYGPIVDRYLYPLIPVAGILLLGGIEKPFEVSRSLALVHSAVGWLAVSAFLLAANSLAYDVARFRAGNTAVAMGYRSEVVDAGYEWVGFQAHGIGRLTPTNYGLNWYDEFLPASRPCALISNGPLGGDTLRLIRIDHSAYRQFLYFGPAQPLFLYGMIDAGCPVPPPSVDLGAAIRQRFGDRPMAA
jgi:hypothetical protein